MFDIKKRIMDLCGKHQKSKETADSLIIDEVMEDENMFDNKLTENLVIDQLALEAYEKGEYETSLKLYSELIETNPNAHQYYQFRGTVYEDMGNDVLALQDFVKSVELEPRNTTSLYRIAMVYHRKNELQKSIPYLEKAYAILSEHGKSFGYDDLMGGLYNNILMVHKRVIAYNLANFLVQVGRLDEGECILDELIEYCPDYSYPFFIKALVCYKRENHQEAIVYATKAVEKGHPSAQAILDVLEELKREEEVKLSSEDKEFVAESMDTEGIIMAATMAVMAVAQGNFQLGKEAFFTLYVLTAENPKRLLHIPTDEYAVVGRALGLSLVYVDEDKYELVARETSDYAFYCLSQAIMNNPSDKKLHLTRACILGQAAISSFYKTIANAMELPETNPFGSFMESIPLIVRTNDFRFAMGRYDIEKSEVTVFEPDFQHFYNLCIRPDVKTINAKSYIDKVNEYIKDEINKI